MSLIKEILFIIEPFGITIDLSDKTQVFEMIKFFDDSYRDGKTLISDDSWDLLVEYYNRTFTNDYEEEVAIEGSTPFLMGSPKKKAYTQHDLDLFATKYPGPYLISDKMDGVTLMGDHSLDRIRLFSKGGGKDGEVLNGQENLPQINFNIPEGQAIRGELVLPKENFQFTSDRKSNRDVASAFVRTQDKEERHLNEAKLLDFYAYKLYSRPPIEMNILEMYSVINQLGFKTPTYIILEYLSVDELTSYFKQRKEEAPYDMDGLFITPLTVPMGLSEQKKIDSVIAFKIKQEGVLVKITGVHWNTSGNRVLKPVVEYEPIRIITGIDANGNEMAYTLKNATAHNARTLVNEGIGLGALVWVARNGDAAPGVVKVEQRSDHIIYPPGEFHWNESNVDLIADNETPESISKNIDKMAKFLNVKGVGPKVAEAFVIKYGIENIHDFIKNFVMSNLNDRIVNDIRNILIENKDNILIYMVSSSLFSPKFGKVKLEEFINAYYPMSELFNTTPEALHEVIKNLSFRKQEEDFIKKLFEFINIYGDAIYKFSTYGPHELTRASTLRSSQNPRVSALRNTASRISSLREFQGSNLRHSQNPRVSALRTSLRNVKDNRASSSFPDSLIHENSSALRVSTIEKRSSPDPRSSPLKGIPIPELQTTLKSSDDHRVYLLNLIVGKRAVIMPDVDLPEDIVKTLTLVLSDPEVVIYNEFPGTFENALIININKLL